jgi:uncharacterized protein YdhG (YjbR/CyaY superfamily)
MSKCYFLKDKTQRFNGKTSDNNREASQKECPFSRRTFRKEVNTLVRKAVKKGALGVYASALKLQQDKESKAKMAKRRAMEKEDSSSSEDSVSVHNIEKRVPRNLAKPIPRKIVKRTLHCPMISEVHVLHSPDAWAPCSHKINSGFSGPRVSKMSRRRNT